MNKIMFEGKLSIIVPAYNEGAFIYNNIIETVQTVKPFCETYEIIVVDDGSSDDTCREAHRAVADHPCVRVVTYNHNLGKGNALREGFELSTGDLVAFLDADLDLHPSQLQTLYAVMQETGADVVIGSKRHPQSRLDYPWSRKVISLVYFGLIKGLFGLPLNDTQTGLKLFRRHVLADAFPRIKTFGYAYDLELLVAATRFGYQIAEAPVDLRYQRSAQGHIKVSTILVMCWDTLRIFYRASFWKWLQPTLSTRIWMIAFIIGLVAASFGMASVMTFLDLPTWMHQLGYYLMLKFLPRDWRNILLIAGGMVVSIMALIQLNKSLMRAFAHADGGDMAGIWRKKQNE